MKAEAFIAEGNLSAAEIELKNALRDDQGNLQALTLVSKIYSQQGRVRDSYQILSVLKRLNPDDADSLATLAAIEAAAGLRDQALIDARRALELDPQQNEAPILLVELANSLDSAAKTEQWLKSLQPTAAINTALGALELKRGQAGSAQIYFEKALALDPYFATAYAGQFQIQLSLKKTEEADALFAKAAENSKPRSGLKIRYAQYLQQTKGDDAAAAELDSILEKAPDYLPAVSVAAELAAKMGDNKKATTLIEKAFKLDPIDPTAMRLKGTLLFIDKKTDEAIKQLEQTTELYPDDIKANYQIALAYLAKKDFGKAKGRLARVVKAVPTHLEANALLSTVQVQEEDYSGAIITLQDFLKKSPESVQGYLLLAEVYNRKGDSQAAVSIYKKLDELLPEENSQLDFLSGVSYLQGQDRNRARSSFEAALAGDPLHLQSVEQLTALDMGDRNFDDALQRIDQTIAASPKTSVLHAIRGQILNSKGDATAAAASYNKAIELDPANRTARMLYSRMLRSQGNDDAALAQSQAIIASSPDDIGALTTIASIQETRSQFTKAIATYQRMLEVNANYLPALNNLAYLYSTQANKPEEAFTLAQKARELSPTSPYTADTLGWIVYKRGDFQWSLSLLRDSYSKLSDNTEVAFHLGSAYYALGQRDSGIQYLSQATSKDDAFTGKDEASALLAILHIDTRGPNPKGFEKVKQRLKNESTDAQALATLATLQLRSGEEKDARSNFEKALKASPENVFAKLGLAEILSSDTANAARIYSLANDAKDLKSELGRVKALQGLSLLQQGKAEQAKTIFNSIALDQLPDSLKARIEAY